MGHVQMTCCIIRKLEMVNNILESNTIKCSDTGHFSVDYSGDFTMGVATLVDRIELEGNPSQFCIGLTLEAVFLIDGAGKKSNREAVHRECYETMFPVAAGIINFLAVNSGMDGGITIQKHPLEQVNFGAKPKGKNEKIIDFPTDL